MIAVVGVLSYAPERWFGRVQTIETYGEDESAQSRLWLWQMSWAMALKHPVTGAGVNWGWNLNWANQELRDSGLAPLTKPRALHSIWFEMLSCHGFLGLALFIGVIIVGVVDARWLIRQTRNKPDLEWANQFGRMLQASIAGYVVGGSFVSLNMYDGFYAVVLLGAAARRIVAAELATQDRALKPAFSGTFSTPSAAHARLGQPVVRM
jgi:probable O-glycosylation ligase (exosortase A-associated)